MNLVYYEVRSKKSPTGEGWRKCKQPYLDEQTAMDHAKFLLGWGWVKDVQVFRMTEELISWEEAPAKTPDPQTPKPEVLEICESCGVTMTFVGENTWQCGRCGYTLTRR